MTAGEPGRRRGRQDDLLQTSCWCGKDTEILVRPEDVRAGLTRSCGMAGCRRPSRDQ